MDTRAFEIIIDAGLAVAVAIAIYVIWRLFSSLQQEQAARQKTRSMLESAEHLGGIGTWSINVETQSLYWSKRVFEIHGRDRAKGMPELSNGINYYHPEDRPMVSQVVEMALEHGEDFEFTARLICEDGSEKRVVSRGMCETDRSGKVTDVYGIFIETAQVIELALSINDNFPESERGA